MALIHIAPTQSNSLNIQLPKRIHPDLKQCGASRAYRVLKTAWDLARLFGKRTTIHGVNRLLGETEGRYERILWFLTVILAFAGSIYVSLILSRRFSEEKFQTVVDNTRMPVYKIYFPVITICNLNTLNWARISEARSRFLPNETSTEKLRFFEKVLGAYDLMGFAKFDEFSALNRQDLELLNHINFSLVVDFMTWRCEEFLEECEWRRVKKNCCEIFSKRRTKNGPCWSFNSLETEEGKRMQSKDPMWPWRTGGAGPTSALQVRVLINSDKHYPESKNQKGLRVMVTEPYVWHEEPIQVIENTETMIEIEPVMYFYDNDTRSISSDQRQCVFEDERSSTNFKSLQNYIYMFENCQAECHQEYLMHYCNCSMDLLFPPGKRFQLRVHSGNLNFPCSTKGQYPPCKATDLLCLAEYNDHFQYTLEPGEDQFVQNEPKGLECKCLLNCYSLAYVPDLRTSFLPPHENARNNASCVDLDVHFRFDTLMVYRTSLVFNWVDLMVAFGGIAGLFLGCSLISAMELLYFACIEMPHFVFERVRCSRKQHSQLTESNPHRGDYHKFSGFIQRNLANDGNQLEEFIFKSNAIFAIPEGSRLRQGHLLTMQRSTDKK